MLTLPDNEAPRIAFEEATNKPIKKVRGGQPLQWIRTIQTDFKLVNISRFTHQPRRGKKTSCGRRRRQIRGMCSNFVQLKFELRPIRHPIRNRQYFRVFVISMVLASYMLDYITNRKTSQLEKNILTWPCLATEFEPNA